MRPSLVAMVLTARGRFAAMSLRKRAMLPIVDEIGLVENDEIGAGELILEHFFERIVVIERGIGGALRGELFRIVGEAPGSDGRGIDDGDDAIDGEARPHARPIEGFDERLRQREAGGFDHDVIGRDRQREQGLDRRDEIIGDRAAEAAVGQLDDIFFGTGRHRRSCAKSRRRRRRRRIR